MVANMCRNGREVGGSRGGADISQCLLCYSREVGKGASPGCGRETPQGKEGKMGTFKSVVSQV